MAQIQTNTFEQFMATVKPWMLDANGRFKGTDAGVAYDAEGMTPEQYYAYMNEQVGDPMARDGADSGPRARGNADASWKPGVVSTNKGGVLGNWGVPLAMIAAPFAASSMGLGAGSPAAGPGSAGWGLDLGGADLAAGPGSPGWGLDLGLDSAIGTTPVTSAEGASALAAAKSGMPLAEIAKKWGPSVAKMVIAAGASVLANDGNSTGGGVNSNIDSMISSALGNTKSMEQDYNTLFKPWAIDQVGKATARGDAGYDTLMGLASAPNKNLASFQTYVDRVGSQGYRDQQRGQAMGEVQQQADIGLGSARRAAMARGVDPSKFALQANANSINTAAAKTKAAADAETGAWDQWGKGAQTAAGMHMADSTNRANLVTGANNLGGAGLAAGTKVAAIDSGYRGGLTSGFNNTLSTVTGANNAANNQANYDKEHGLSGIVNAGLATAATKWLTDKGGDAITNIFE